MGVWGTGIFQDDTASDIREDFRAHLGDGLSGPDATARIREEYKSSLADPHEAGVVWLALAAVQWKLGRLEPETLAHALHVIDSGSDLERWNVGTKDHAKRKTTLDKLKIQLTSPQPAAKKVARQVRCECDWQVGELVAYRLLSGQQIVFRVIDHYADKGGTYPVCELLNWVGQSFPSREEWLSTPIRLGQPQLERDRPIKQLMLVGLNKKWASRTQKLEIKLQPSQERDRSQIIHFKYLDGFLKGCFQLE